MLAAVVCAVLCVARGYEAIAQWIHAQEKSLWYRLGYFRTPPKEGAFRYLLNMLDPEQLEQALRDWIAPHAEVEPDEMALLAINGKTLCKTLGQHGKSVHLLSLFDQQTGCVLSQLTVAEKTNEIKAAPEILQTLALEG